MLYKLQKKETAGMDAFAPLHDSGGGMTTPRSKRNRRGFALPIPLFWRLCLMAMLCLLGIGSANATKLSTTNYVRYNYSGYDADKGYFSEFIIFFYSSDGGTISDAYLRVNGKEVLKFGYDSQATSWGQSGRSVLLQRLENDIYIEAINYGGAVGDYRGCTWGAVPFGSALQFVTKPSSNMYGMYVRVFYPQSWLTGESFYCSQKWVSASGLDDPKNNNYNGNYVGGYLTSVFPNINGWLNSASPKLRLKKNGYYDLSPFTMPGLSHAQEIINHGGTPVYAFSFIAGDNTAFQVWWPQSITSDYTYKYTTDNNGWLKANGDSYTPKARIALKAIYAKDWYLDFCHVQSATSVKVEQDITSWTKYTISWKKDAIDKNGDILNDLDKAGKVTTTAGKWAIFYKKEGDKDWTQTGTTNIDDSTYTFTLPGAQQKQGPKDYTFMVQREYFDQGILAQTVTKKIYTDDPTPTQVTVTPVDNDRKFLVKWEVDPNSAPSAELDSFRLYYRIINPVTKNAVIPSDIGNATRIYCYFDRYMFTVPYVYGTSKYEYIFELPEGQLNQGKLTYEFVVQRKKFNLCTNNGLQNFDINTDLLTIGSVSAIADTSNIKVQIEKINGRWDSANDNKFKFQIWRRTEQTTWVQLGNDMTVIDSVFIDNVAVSCTPYSYQVRLFYNSNIPYQTVESSKPIMKSNISNPNNEIKELKASKGFFNNKVDISWEPKSGNSFDSYTIARKLKGVANATEQTIYQVASSGILQYSYTDPNAIPGLYYDYTVYGNITCSGTVSPMHHLTTTGFIQPYGVVSGKITYEGGTAVEGVQVVAQPEGDFKNRALYLNGERRLETKLKDDFDPSNKTIQLWLRTTSDDNLNIFRADISATDIYYFAVVKNASQHISVNFGSSTIEFKNYAVPKGEFVHLTVSFSNNAGNITAYLYVNGTLKDTAGTGAAISTSYFNQERQLLHIGGFNCYIDEFRVWNKILNEDEIKNNYDRYITGKEEGLNIYYRFDEPTGDEVFDISGRNGIYNENHGKISVTDDYAHSSVVPASAQLGIKGITDKNGNYLISTIPYSGEGNNVILQPILGVHSFNPSDKPLYFNQQSNTYSNVDFIDISSFKVKGNVYYENSSYPVADAMLKIDGAVAVRDGAAITTAADGSYEINVPIGKHWISVEKTGHVFVNIPIDNGVKGNKTIRQDGRYPAYKEGLVEQPRYNFIDSISGINFEDATTVKIVGRVAGGDIERQKQLGFGLSKANIGSATVTLKNQETYSFGDTIRTAMLGGKRASNTNISTTSGITGGVFATVQTDSVTGEFMAIVPPVRFEISNVKVGKNNLEESGAKGDVFVYSKIGFDIDPNKETTLKLYEQKTVSINNRDSVMDVLTDSLTQVHDSLIITRYNEPMLTVIDRDAQPGMWGDSVYYYVNASGRDTVPLYKNGNYTYGNPVFSQATYEYTWDISVFERYENKDKAVVYDTVPKSDLIININNGLASQAVYIDPLNQIDSLVVVNNGVMLNSAGKASYVWNTGFPNIAGNKLLSVSMNFNIGGKTYPDANAPFGSGGTFTAYLLGSVPSAGSNFVTVGPDDVDIVLHDPPGSNSSAYVERGTITSTMSESTFDVEVSEEGSFTAHCGPKFATANGLGVAYVQETEAIFDFVGSAGGKQTWSKGNRVTKTLNITNKISTSDDPAHVGSMADVYIGTSSNITFGQVRRLAIYPAGEYADGGVDKDPIYDKPNKDEAKYALFAQEKVSADQRFQTVFTYTQDYIINTQIPNMKQLRNSLIDVVGTMPDAASITNWTRDGEPVKQLYFSTLAKTDPNFGKDTTVYTVFYHPSAEKSEKVDEVSAYNHYIDSWEKRIEGNEKDKVNIFDGRAKAESKSMTNHSFDAGVKYAESMTVEYDSVRIHNSANNWHGQFSQTLGGKAAGLGWEESFVVGRQNTDNYKGETETKNSLAFGYELSESGRDALTVDVYNPVEDDMRKAVLPDTAKLYSLHGYMFQTRAGQTACPYEGGDSTLYYRKDNKAIELNKATFQIEKPELYINSAKSASAANIASGREATFTLELQNLSEAHLPVQYNLSVADNSNPKGLILSIDGLPLTSARPYTVDFGTPITKTLKVKQSSQDILDYGGIQLVLASMCDDKISSEVKIDSIKFVPSSSESHLAARTALVNIEGSADGTISKDTAVVFTISDYDVNFRNFADLMLQYKNANSTSWNTAQVFVYYRADGTTLSNIDMSDAIRFDNTQTTLSYRYSMASLPDGAYDFRVVSRTLYGSNSYVTVPSNVERVIKDITAPKQFGAALPLSGILTADDEISITFNEDIQSGVIQDVLNTELTNIEVKAIKNGSVIAHNTALKLSGGAPAATEASFALANTSFTLEAYFQREKDVAGTLIAHGSDLSIGFNASNKVVVNIGGQQFVSDTIFDDNTWSYLVFAYNNTGKTFSLTLFSQAKNLYLEFGNTVAPAVTTAYTGTGRLYIGNNAAKTSGITANIHEISLWNNVSTIIHKDGTKSGNEQGLIGYWQLGEGHGIAGADKARSRHLILPASNMWYSLIDNYALQFNGAANNYAEIDAAKLGITAEDDFTLEFWFYGGAQSNATMFSCGDGVLDAEPQKSFSVGFNKDGKLVLRSDSIETTLSETNYLDNTWHHFALNILRQGSNIAYVDGVGVKQLPYAAVANVGSNKYVLGARDYNKPAVGGIKQPFRDNYFTGAIDELRVWKGTLTGDIIRENIYNQLTGKEAGLVAYYPFNKQVLVSNQPTTVYTLENLIPLSGIKTQVIVGNDTTWVQADSLAVLYGAAALQQAVAPTIKPVKALENVAHTFVADNRKIIISITEAPSLIEGTTLEISVKNILDLNGNKSKQSRWTAFVNRNRLVWETDQVNITKEVGASYTFTARIANNSGVAAGYNIEDLPSWLTVSSTAGTLQPLQSKDLNFTVSSSVNIGSYEASVGLRGNTGTVNLPVSLHVTSVKPGWSVNPNDWESTMTITGQIQILNVPQDDTEDILAAFVNDTCVGLVSPIYVREHDAYYTFLTVYGNASTAGRALKFKIWDASTGDIYSVVESKLGGVTQNFTFMADAIKGAAQNPVIHNATGMIEQSIALVNGWNWISVNVLNDSPTILQQFKDKAGTDGEQIKAYNGYLQNPNWIGSTSFTSIDKAQAYLVKMNVNKNVSFDGMPAVSAQSPISIVSGWNWIGYIPQFTLPVNGALADLNATTDDQIKSQTAYRIYAGNEIGWIGTLNYLRAGEGYMYNSGAATSKTFKYPSTSPQVYRSPMRIMAQPAENRWATDVHKYSNTMTMTSIVMENTVEVHSDLIEVAAFDDNGECRGSIMLQNVPEIAAHPYLGFLMVFGEPGDNLILKVYDHATGKECIANNTVSFATNAIHGNTITPYEIQLSTTGIAEIGIEQIAIYPNPVKEYLMIRCGNLKIETVEIVDLSGRVIKIAKAIEDKNSINVSKLAKGIYLLKITVNDEVKTFKFTKQ